MAITYSDHLESQQHLINAIHHASRAHVRTPSASIAEAIALLEGALAVVRAERASTMPREYDDTVEAP